jgi:predicted dehydrogenase
MELRVDLARPIAADQRRVPMSTSSLPRIACAVVGLKQGLETVHVLLNHPAFQLKLVCDLDPEPMDWLTGKKPIESSEQDYGKFPHIRKLMAEIRKSPGIPQIEYTADYAAVLARPDIQAVLLFVPDALHEEFALAALRAGKYVLCTKPMAMSIESAETIAAEARKFPQHFMLGFQYCYSPFAQTVMQQVKRGVIGQPRQLSFHYHRGQFRPIYRKRAVSRGPIVQECCHWFDLFYLFTGQAKFTKVAGFGGLEVLGATQDIEDNGSLIIEYENKMRASLLFTYFRPSKLPEFFTLNGDKGQIRGTFDSLTIENDQGIETIAIANNRRLPGLFHDGYYEMHDAFADMIRTGQEPYAGWEAGLENVLISDAAQKALDRGGLVARAAPTRSAP